jgi:hypothetical protein
MSPRPSPRLATAASTEEAFASLVRDALANDPVPASPSTERYLVDLLGGFLRTDPERLDRVLGIELMRAAQLEPRQRYRKLKEIADTTLFLAGLFLDYLEASLPATDYYFAVGTRAYLDLGSLCDDARIEGSGRGQTFTELGRRFEDFVRVLGTISDRDIFPDDRRGLAIYRRWLETGNSRDERRLVGLGFIPSRGTNSTSRH